MLKERLHMRRRPAVHRHIGEDARGGSTGAQPLAARIIVAISAFDSTYSGQYLSGSPAAWQPAVTPCARSVSANGVAQS